MTVSPAKLDPTQGIGLPFPDRWEHSQRKKTRRQTIFANKVVALAQETVKYRSVARFSWELVDSRVICALLNVKVPAGRNDRGALTKAAAERFDKSRKRLLSDHAGVLREVWLPAADAEVVIGIALMVQPTISGDDRWAKVNTKHRALEFLYRRKLGKTMKVNIVNAFLTAHKELVLVPVGQKKGDLRSGLRLLEGSDAERPPPWKHQLEARQSLDRHELDSPDRGALIVLPTGSGKTETVAEWLLDRMERDPQSRVDGRRTSLKRVINQLCNSQRRSPVPVSRVARRNLVGSTSAGRTLIPGCARRAFGVPCVSVSTGLSSSVTRKHAIYT